jgi:hypothetical protein
MDLSPGTTYYLSAGDQSNLQSFSRELKFRTLPVHDEFNFVAGGDNGGWKIVKEVSRALNAVVITVIFLGTKLFKHVEEYKRFFTILSNFHFRKGKI